jgi:hypothetical protein
MTIHLEKEGDGTEIEITPEMLEAGISGRRTTGSAAPTRPQSSWISRQV